jgi:hypothetical protein
VSSSPGEIRCREEGIHRAMRRDAEVTLTATPDAGQQLTGWSGACEGTSLTCSVVMGEDLDVAATFEPRHYSLAAYVVGSGTISSDPGDIECRTGAPTGPRSR